MSKIYNEENMANIASALLEYRENKNCTKNWKKDLKEEFSNGTNKNVYLQQLRNYFDFDKVLKAVSNKSTQDEVKDYLNNSIK